MRRFCLLLTIQCTGIWAGPMENPLEKSDSQTDLPPPFIILPASSQSDIQKPSKFGVQVIEENVQIITPSTINDIRPQLSISTKRVNKTTSTTFSTTTTTTTFSTTTTTTTLSTTTTTTERTFYPVETTDTTTRSTTTRKPGITTATATTTTTSSTTTTNDDLLNIQVSITIDQEKKSETSTESADSAELTELPSSKNGEVSNEKVSTTSTNMYTDGEDNLIEDFAVDFGSEDNKEENNEIQTEEEYVFVKDFDHWKLITSFNVSENIVVSKYKSDLTGLTVIFTESDSPIVNGYFCLATEAHDNDGLPHTLEHLVFLGSEEYPYKEVLDLLANRCLADRTNAWTDTDHTCYTVYTAGSSGFLHILPVYMDHILHPLLREEDYLTEVHHVNGNGLDAGVVYSEMQAVEQDSSNIMYFALIKALYPEDSGYEYETGGYLANLRDSTNIHKVRAYHQEFYRPENLVLTITGKMKETDLFKALTKTEEKILQKRQFVRLEKYEKPWQKPLAKIPETQESEILVEFPADDESVGNMAFAWRLPVNISQDVEMLQAYRLLLKYLTSTQVSPLEATFVETTDPLATSVSADLLEVREPSILIEFENIPLERIDEVKQKMEDVFQGIVNDGPGKFDIDRIHNFIDRAVLNYMKEVENSPHLFVPDATVLDQLYGQNENNLEEFVLSSNLNKKFRNKDSAFWLKLIDDLFIKMPKYYVKGIPSKKKQQELRRLEEERIISQKEELGEEGLKKQKELVEDAIESQQLPSNQVLNKIPLGDVNAIQFRPISSYNRTQPTHLLNFKEIPFKIHVDDVLSEFVQIYILLDTTVLTDRERDLLPLLLDTWLLSPIKKNGEVTSIEDVVKRRSKNVLHIQNSLGFSGSSFSPGAYSDAYVLELQTELEKFDEAISYISDALNYPYLQENKISSAASNLRNNIPPLKQSETTILRALYDSLYFGRNNSIYKSNFIRQMSVLDCVLKDIEDTPGKVLSELETMIQELMNPSTAFVYIGTNVKKFSDMYGKDMGPLKSLFNESSTKINEELLSQRFELNSEHVYRGKEYQTNKHYIFGVAGTESCYMKQGIYYNNTDWTHEEVADLRVLLQYLSDRMYDEVRGSGLTYGVSMSVSVTEGRFSLSFSRSSRLFRAYSAVRDILARYSENPNAWDSTLLDSARGSVIYAWAEKEETVENLLSQAMKAYVRNTDTKYNRDFVYALGNTSTEAIKKLATRILPAFLDPATTQTVIVCNPSAVEDLVEEFQEFNIPLQIIESLDQSFLVD